MALICISVYNLESYEYIRRVFVEVLCHGFLGFAKVIFFPMKLFKKIYLHGKFVVEFIIEFLFLLSHMFPSMNKFLITKNVSPSFSKIGKLQVFALYLPKFLSLEYV